MRKIFEKTLDFRVKKILDTEIKMIFVKAIFFFIKYYMDYNGIYNNFYLNAK